MSIILDGMGHIMIIYSYAAESETIKCIMIIHVIVVLDVQTSRQAPVYELPYPITLRGAK